MNHKYDLFEKFPDGSSLWRACVVGLDGTRRYMRDLAQRSPNRFYAMHLLSGKIVPLEIDSNGLVIPPRSAKRSKAAAA